ncbi:hypothetical protein [Micromonospora sp. WMMD964]|uniref:hypothetical protein n=1 Tax=Micromonospora sp. WMMD964 TaxID=3016091 RepID=UPI00249CCE0F|nr:hypothetical protein [Micromonospora sp. WMMD964]WFF01954.1 hypothetical protein O7616_03975 [Micromonospora sp. WMMD964]
MGALRLGEQVQYLIAPAVLTALGVTTGGWGWLPTAAIFVLVAAAIMPAVAWAERTPRLGTQAPKPSMTPVP